MKTNKKSLLENPIELSENLAEIEISYKKKIKATDLEKITTSSDVHNLLRNIWSKNLEYKEEAYMLCLNRANRVLGFLKVSSGGIHGTVIDIRIVLQVALKTNSVGIILSHNHPSGNKNPSEADIQLTKKLKEACKLMDISFLDHMILTEEEYFSFADNGML